MPARTVGDRRARLLARHTVLLLGLAVAAPAAAQEMIFAGPAAYDRARVSGFWWRGEINGEVSPPGLQDIGGLDATDDLGLEGGTNGFVVRADFAPARQHRFQLAVAGLAQSGAGDIAFEDADLVSAADISLFDVRGTYQYLFVMRPWVQAGVIGGVGYFNSQVDVAVAAAPVDGADAAPPFIEIAESYDAPYPLIGAGLRVEAEDVLGIYTEISGFPTVDAGDQSGWMLNLEIDFIVSPTPYLSLIAGYKRYRLALEDGTGVAVDLVWDGFVVGGQYVF